MEYIKTFESFLFLLNEGLIKTFESDIVYREITHQLVRLNIDYEGNFNTETINIKLNNFNKINYELITTLFEVIFASVVNRGGWFPAKMIITNLIGNKNTSIFDLNKILKYHNNVYSIELIFESKFDKIEINIPDKLYHLSIQEYETKILKKGLSPKSKSKITYHPDRIYLCKTIQDCELLIPAMKFKNLEEITYHKMTKNTKFNKNTKFVIFEIDNAEHIINTKNNLLYKDPNYKNGYYIINCVNPIFINKIKEI